jgi:HK97 family phage portal protein
MPRPYQRKSVARIDYNQQWEDLVSERLQKAIFSTSRRSRKSPHAWDFNPIAVLDVLEYKDKVNALSWELLQRMAKKDSIVAAVIQTRVNQVSRFCYPSRYREDKVGFKVRPRDPKATIDQTLEKKIIEIENFIENCGKEDNSVVRDTFPEFLKKIVRDRLTYDAVAVELVPTRKGELVSFHAVDASTIRLVLPKDGSGSLQNLRKKDIGYQQVIQGDIKAEFTFEEMGYGVFNPQTNINQFGYGYSELEQLVSIITSHLYAESYNRLFFQQGSLPKGMINFKNGNMSRQKLEAFKRQWQMQIAGLTGAWRMPMISGVEVQYIPMHLSNQDMEFAKWMDYLVNIICSIYAISPDEIGFPSRGGSGTDSHERALFDNSYESKLRNSRDKGLYPLLDFISQFINKHIVWKIDPSLVFIFEGLDRRQGLERIEALNKEIRAYKTINEVRREEELPPVEFGDIILDPMYVNYLIQKEQIDLQKESTKLTNWVQLVGLKTQMIQLQQTEQSVNGISSGNSDLSEEEEAALDQELDDVLSDDVPLLNRIKEEVEGSFEEDEADE